MRQLLLLPCLAMFACSPAEQSSPETSEAAESSSEIAFVDTPPSAAAEPPALQQVWVTAGLSSPEGVAVQGDTLFISNVVGEGADKDGEGWITRLSMDGAVLEEKWVDGLNAPKGMAVRDGKLFVSDFDQYHVIDIASATIENTYVVEGAGFLNDITTWQGGVYMSDSGSARIFQVDVNGYKEWLADERLGGVNGLTPDGDRLLIATMRSGSLFETRGAGELTEIATGMENADGIAVLDDGSYLVSSWPGQIWHVTQDGATTEIHDTIDVPVFQNDLTRVGDMIIVPNWQPGTVTAWRIADYL